jgi:hypothetical protein
MFTVTYTDSRSASGIGTSVTSDVDAFAARYGVTVLTVSRTVEASAPMPSGNCIYGGNAIGHSAGFCTADSCY